MLTDRELAERLPVVLAAWGLDGAQVVPLGGGMNSVTALVTAGDQRLVAKWVPMARRDDLERGARLSARLAGKGMVTGTPLPTLAGEVVVTLGNGSCTLGAFVPGRALTGGTHDDQVRMADVLARLHHETGAAPATRFFAWLAADHPDLDVEAWVRPAVASARTAYDALPPLTHACLHTDPAPEAFRRDAETGRTGLIDWTGTVVGPVLYDVASAVIYLGGPSSAADFLAEYAARRVLPDEEWTHLDALRRFRWAVQAAYFAERLVAGDLTGTDAAGNRQGLADARCGLEEWS